MRTIRSRIALWALAVLLLLVFLESALVLGGLRGAVEELADRELRGELDRIARQVTDMRLTELRRRAEEPAAQLGDLIFELQDELELRDRRHGGSLLYTIHREDQLIAGSQGIVSGFGPGKAEARRGGLEFREVEDPLLARGGPLRVAMLRLGPYRIEVAHGLGPLAAIYSATRAQLLAILAVVSLLGALGAFWIARRALEPVRELIDEAQRLRTLSEGSLPRTGRGDEIDDLAKVLNELMARVRADVLRIQRFTADAAHEIRTPLAAIRGHLELLLQRVDEDSQQTLVSVLDEVSRLSRLVDQLLFLEKIQQDSEVDKRARVDLGEIASDLVGHLRVLAQEQEIELQGSFEAAPVDGDAEKLRQVLLNLIDNAMKFTPAGGRIEVDVRSDGDSVRARLRDTGPGVSEEQLEQIFERFASDRSRTGAGTGLGLPIARAIARAHGGDLWAERSEGAGAVFVCELPRAAGGSA